jgi:hypothetical protein
MIKFSLIEAMFKNMQKTPDLDIDAPLLWGFFFTDPSAKKLQKLAKHLKKDGFRFVDLYVPELDDDEDEYYFLHVERIEHHTVGTLHKRNQEFYALADKFCIRTYDGMDVGQIPST